MSRKMSTELEEAGLFSPNQSQVAPRDEKHEFFDSLFDKSPEILSPSNSTLNSSRCLGSRGSKRNRISGSEKTNTHAGDTTDTPLTPTRLHHYHHQRKRNKIDENDAHSQQKCGDLHRLATRQHHGQTDRATWKRIESIERERVGERQDMAPRGTELELEQLKQQQVHVERPESPPPQQQSEQQQWEHKLKPISGDKSKSFTQESERKLALRINHHHYRDRNQLHHHLDNYDSENKCAYCSIDHMDKTSKTARATATSIATALPLSAQLSVGNLIKRLKHPLNESSEENSSAIHKYRSLNNCHHRHLHHNNCHHHHHDEEQQQQQQQQLLHLQLNQHNRYEETKCTSKCGEASQQDRLSPSRLWPLLQIKNIIAQDSENSGGVGDAEHRHKRDDANSQRFYDDKMTLEAAKKSTPPLEQRAQPRPQAVVSSRMLKSSHSSSSSSSSSPVSRPKIVNKSSSLTLSPLPPFSFMKTTSLIYHIIVIIMLLLYKNSCDNQQISLALALSSSSSSAAAGTVTGGAHQQTHRTRLAPLEQVHGMGPANEPNVMFGRARAVGSGGSLDDIKPRTKKTKIVMMMAPKTEGGKQKSIEIVDDDDDEDNSSVSFINPRQLAAAVSEEQAVAAAEDRNLDHLWALQQQLTSDENDNIGARSDVLNYGRLGDSPGHHLFDKRHLVASNFNFGDLSTVKAGGSKGQHQQQLQPHRSAGGNNSIDCNRLANFWMFFHASYPALSSQLLLWAGLNGGSEQARSEQLLLSRSSQFGRSISHLLEQAEHLASTQYMPERNHHQQGAQLAAATWLSKVSSNPVYARLVQQLRNKQDQQQQKPHWTENGSGNNNMGQQRPTTVTIGASGDQLESKTNQLEQSGTSGEQTIVEEQQVDTPPKQQEYVYGRLIHYPHDIGDSEGNSKNMAHTLDNLRLLNHHTRQQQELEQHSNADRDIENNQIPMAIELADQNWRKSDKSGVDSARNNYVYGKVLLKPEQAGYEQRRERPNPLGTLRRLASEQQRFLESDIADARSDLRIQSPTRPSSSLLAQPISSHAKTTSPFSSDTLGRVPINPLSNDDDISLTKVHHQTSNDNKQRGLQHLRSVDEDGGISVDRE